VLKLKAEMLLLKIVTQKIGGNKGKKYKKIIVTRLKKQRVPDLISCRKNQLRKKSTQTLPAELSEDLFLLSRPIITAICYGR